MDGGGCTFILTAILTYTFIIPIANGRMNENEIKIHKATETNGIYIIFSHVCLTLQTYNERAKKVHN